MLNNRSILLTGGARGLGAEIAKCLSEYGAKIIIADIDVEEGRRTANRLGVHFLHVDIEDPNSIETLLKDVAKLSVPEGANIVPDESIISRVTAPEADAPLCSTCTDICCGLTLKGITGESQ